jgi:PhnO protein
MNTKLGDGLFVRKVNLNDLKTIHNFVNLLEDEEFDYGIFKSAFYLNLLNTDYIYLIAEFNQKAIGYLSCHTQLLLHHGGQRIGEIQEMYVDMDKRYMGVGKLLLDKLKLLSKINGVHQLEVTANRKRKDSHKFYLKENFEETHKKFVYKIDINKTKNP